MDDRMGTVLLLPVTLRAPNIQSAIKVVGVVRVAKSWFVDMGILANAPCFKP